MVVEDANKSAVDWTGFLGGPLRTAHVGEGDLLNSWPDESPRLLWNTKGLGGGYPEVLVVGDAVFTLGCIGKSGNLQCLDRLTGQVRWRQAAPAIGASTPAWADDRVYLYMVGFSIAPRMASRSARFPSKGTPALPRLPGAT